MSTRPAAYLVIYSLLLMLPEMGWTQEPGPSDQEVLNRVAALFNAGKELERIGRSDSAQSLYLSALEIVRSQDRSSVDAGVFEGAILEVMGDLHRAGSDLESAVAYYDSATARLDDLRKYLGSEDRLKLAAFLSPLYQRWVLTTLARSRALGVHGSAVTALAIADRGRSRTLRDMKVSWALTGGRSQWVLSYSPGMNMARVGTGLVAKLDSMDLPALYYQLTSDTLLVWMITGRGEVSVTRSAVPRDTLNAIAERLQHAVGSRPGSASTDWRASARPLARLLLPRDLVLTVPSGELLIVPDGGLAQIPFALLPIGLDETLGQRYAVRYMQGLANLTDVSANVRFGPSDFRQVAAERVLVAGNPRMPVVQIQGESFRPSALPFSETEAREVGDLLGAEPLIGPAASEARVFTEMEDAAVIHLSTHGHAFDTEAQTNDSYIVLADGDGEDGLMTIHELLERGPPLRAELVVLSACKTAVGNLREAEGTMGLQRAFFAKGAVSVVVSLWSVKDRATMILMKSFYEEWLNNGVGKAEALRRAQARVRQMPGWEHPYYWASFQLFGDG